MTSRLAVNCLYFREFYEATMFGGETMMHWCKREVQWAADWLMKTHITSGPKSDKWKEADQLVVMVRLSLLAVVFTGCLLRCAFST